MKRFISSILALVMVLTLSCGGAAAAKDISPMASATLSRYTIALIAGKSREVVIDYSVTATNTATSLGVSSIKIYKSDGTYVTTITGTTSNGLLRASGIVHAGSYTYTGTSGTSYYAEVTVTATIGSTTDSKTVTTATVKAP